MVFEFFMNLKDNYNFTERNKGDFECRKINLKRFLES